MSSSDRLSLYGLMVKPIQRFPQFICLLQVGGCRSSMWKRLDNLHDIVVNTIPSSHIVREH